MLRLLWIFIGLAALVLIPFLIWGGSFEGAFGPEGAVAWLRGHGRWAWAAGMLLLVSDLFLPIPATAVMAGLGLVYGPVAGGLPATAGSVLAGSLGYLLCRRLGRPVAARILGPRDLERGERLFAGGVGGWLVVLSRWLPVFPEVIARMAGLSRMPARPFLGAMICGTAPFAFAFAAIGHLGADHPLPAIALSVILPPVLWLVARRYLRAGRR